ncbi:unnamed protein product [Phytophthora fragariaefolia]|uniref:Unnamed protein product n=1 Tax=Phytophthora fragariaefolia TaxID=1490495 RepID=A0A9W6YHZ2_9STRA|nr:unnamed protein product [Phytophthora fragariaefolia]
MQDFPSVQVIEHPQLYDGSADSLAVPVDIPFVDALASCSQNDELHKTHAPATTSTSNVKIHAYVNRVVKAASEVQAKAKPTPNLTSHSFRRGRAQHANGDPALCAQWIFDRGSWNMTATNKAFAYVFNTTKEDPTAEPTELTKEERLINHQNCVIGELVSMNQGLMKRIGAMEARLANIETDGMVATTSTEFDAAHSSIGMTDKTIKVKSGGSRATSKAPAAVSF